MQPEKFLLSETDMFIALLMNYHLDYKKLRKVIHKLIKRVDPHIGNGFLKFLLETKTPHRYIDQALDERDQLPGIMQSLIDDGHMGMVRHGDNIIPVQLSFDTNEDHVWAVENEDLAAVGVAHQLMNDLNRDRLQCTVFLFRGYGFSCKPKEFDIARTSHNNPYKPKYQNTQYRVAL